MTLISKKKISLKCIYIYSAVYIYVYTALCVRPPELGVPSFVNRKHELSGQGNALSMVLKQESSRIRSLALLAVSHLRLPEAICQLNIANRYLRPEYKVLVLKTYLNERDKFIHFPIPI